MKKEWYEMKLFAIAILLFTSVAYSAGVPEKILSDSIILGKGSSTDSKEIEFNTDDSPNNVKMSVDDSRNATLNTNQMTIGDGTASDTTIVNDRGGSNPFLKYDQGTGKWQVSNDGGAAGDIVVGAVANLPSLIENAGLETSIGSSALTISLKIADGSTDPSGGSEVKVAFRDPTIANGGYNLRSITGALSTVISSGSTAGHSNNAKEFLYVYFLDNSGTVELAWSSSFFDDGSIVSTTAEGGAGGADDPSTIFSTTARSNVPIRFFKKLESTQTVAGTWDAAITEVSERSTPRYTLGSKQIFTSSDTWTRPQGVLAIVVELVSGGGAGGGAVVTAGGQASYGVGGGGGGFSRKFITINLGATETVTIGAGGTGVSGAAGNGGGSTSFGSHLSSTGGSGGSINTSTAGTRATSGVDGGIGSGGDINISGGSSNAGFQIAGSISFGSGGGNSFFSGGTSGLASISTGVDGNNALGFGGGGAGSVNTASQSARAGGDGSDGIIIVWEFY